MSMRTSLGLVVALVVAFAASPAFAVYTGVTVNGGNAQEIASMTISLPGQTSVPVQQSKTEEQRKLGAYFIDTSQAPAPSATANVEFTDRDGRRRTLIVPLGGNGFVVDLAAVAPGSTSGTSTAAASGFQFQLDGFGGVAFYNGQTPATAGVDLSVLYLLGNRDEPGWFLGARGGYQYVENGVAQMTGGGTGTTGSTGTTVSTFMRTGVGLNEGNIVAVAGYTSGPWQIDAHAGVTIADAGIHQQTGVCGGSAGPGCTVFSTTASHDSVVGPTIGARVSRMIYPNIGVYVEYDHTWLKDTGVSPTSGAKFTVFDLNVNTVVGGVSFYFE